MRKNPNIARIRELKRENAFLKREIDDFETARFKSLEAAINLKKKWDRCVEVGSKRKLSTWTTEYSYGYDSWNDPSPWVSEYDSLIGSIFETYAQKIFKLQNILCQNNREIAKLTEEHETRGIPVSEMVGQSNQLTSP